MFACFIWDKDEINECFISNLGIQMQIIILKKSKKSAFCVAEFIFISFQIGMCRYEWELWCNLWIFKNRTLEMFINIYNNFQKVQIYIVTKWRSIQAMSSSWIFFSRQTCYIRHRNKTSCLKKKSKPIYGNSCFWIPLRLVHV